MTFFLSGFMGCGKSTVGRILSTLLSVDFIDMDEYIEQKENMKIPDIFKQKGESYFREQETKAIEELSKKNLLVACGGGAMLNPQNAKIAKDNGQVIFLDVPFNVCYTRIKNDKNRPLVMNNTKEQLKEIYDNRYPVYKESCTFSINGDRLPSELAENIYRILID